MQLKKQFEPSKILKAENIHTELTFMIQIYNTVTKLDKLSL